MTTGLGKRQPNKKTCSSSFFFFFNLSSSLPCLDLSPSPARVYRSLYGARDASTALAVTVAGVYVQTESDERRGKPPAVPGDIPPSAGKWTRPKKKEEKERKKNHEERKRN